MITVHFGTVADDIVTQSLGSHNYPMELVAEDAELMRRMVNQGIDSHLEAVTGTFDWGTRDVGGKPLCSILKCSVDPKGMICLLRRLIEDESEEAHMLREDILTTLDIEELRHHQHHSLN